MESGFPLVMLLGPLPAALLALALGRRRRAALIVGLVTVALLLLLLWLAAPEAGTPGARFAFYGREMTLTPLSRALFLLVYPTLGGLFALGWFRPVGRALVPAGLAVLAPLAAGVMIAPPVLGVVFMAVAAAVLVPAIHSGRYEAAGTAWRYFLLAALAVPLALSAASSPDGGGALSWATPLLAVLLMLGGFPFHIWVGGVGRAASPAVSALVLGVAQMVVVVFALALLDGAPAARTSVAFQTATRWSAALTALIGAFHMSRATTRRDLVAGAVTLDAGFLVLAAPAPGAAGLLLALPALISRYLGLLLIAAGGKPPTGNGATRFARLQRMLPPLLILYGLATLLGLPLTPGFAGRWAQLLAAGQGGDWGPVVLLAAALALGVFGAGRAAPGVLRPAGESSASLVESGFLLLLLGATALLGLFPDLPTAIVARLFGLG